MTHHANATLVFGFLSGAQTTKHLFDQLPSGDDVYEKHKLNFHSIGEGENTEYALTAFYWCCSAQTGITIAKIGQTVFDNTEEYRKRFQSLFAELGIHTTIEPQWLLLGWMD